jgi:hypothetical protein
MPRKGCARAAALSVNAREAQRLTLEAKEGKAKSSPVDVIAVK